MKLIIKEYLASLKERHELDVILPDLLSEMGFNVYSRPAVGTRQYGVDVAAIGEDEDGETKVFLFCVKAGDLTRAEWDTVSPQSVRPSLNEIRDVYIKSRIPRQYADRDIVICLCFGGDVQEQVRAELAGYISDNTTDKVSYQEWNGDRIAGLLLTGVLREELLSAEARSHFRKSVALLDDPDSSVFHFVNLVKKLVEDGDDLQKTRIRIARQINICLWVLFVWAREAGNLESPYRSSEVALLNVWALGCDFVGRRTKQARSMSRIIDQLINLHRGVSHALAAVKIFPLTSKRHALSVAVRSYTSVDVNLKMFDLLGRLALSGLWNIFVPQRVDVLTDEQMQATRSAADEYAQNVADLISNNPILMTPIKDDQAIDIALALTFMESHGRCRSVMRSWLQELIDKTFFAYRTHSKYPCTHTAYRHLIDHPKEHTDKYRKEASRGSILYPTLAMWAAILEDDDALSTMALFKKEYLGHCNFQYWYPDENSEKNFYVNSSVHGSALSNIPVTGDGQETISYVIDECSATDHFGELSAIRFGLWPIVLTACRHYRLPIPAHFFRELVASKTPSTTS